MKKGIGYYANSLFCFLLSWSGDETPSHDNAFRDMSRLRSTGHLLTGQ
jgi:hypothetical protein